MTDSRGHGHVLIHGFVQLGTLHRPAHLCCVHFSACLVYFDGDVTLLLFLIQSPDRQWENQVEDLYRNMQMLFSKRIFCSGVAVSTWSHLIKSALPLEVGDGQGHGYRAGQLPLYAAWMALTSFHSRMLT